MTQLRLERIDDSDWVRIVGPMTKQFVDYLRYRLRPESIRRYDMATNRWHIHWSQINVVASMARHCYGSVDWSLLPVAWQLLIAGAAPPPPVMAEQLLDENELYATLHLLPSAPFDVVKAAYKVLAMQCHPDQGGDGDAMARINAAFETIRRRREAS